MKIIKLHKNNISKVQIAEIAGWFLGGKTVAYPTDTIYGLGCLAEDRRAVEKVSRIKRRDSGKNYILLMKSFCMVHDYCAVSKKQDMYLRKVWAPKNSLFAHLDDLPDKKAVTVILNSRGRLKHLEDDLDRLSVRIPKDRFLLDLLKKINKPIVSTSLNISGKEPLDDLGNIEKYFGVNTPDCAVDMGAIKGKKASRLVDISDIKEIKILRK